MTSTEQNASFTQATAPAASITETTRTRYRSGGLEPVHFITDDGLHTRLWYYETDNHPLDISKLVEGLTLTKVATGTNATTGDAGRTLADAVQLTCTRRPAASKGLLPLCAQYQYLLLPDGTLQAPVLTLFGYARDQRDEHGTLLPNTVLTFEGFAAFADSDTLALKDVKLAKPLGLSVSLVQANYGHQADAIRSTERIATQWYKDDSARNTQTVTEVVTVGQQVATHELLRTSPYANYHDPSGHIMLSRHAQADNLARMDDFLKTLTSNGKAPPEAATTGEWVFFGVMTIVGAIAIVASAGTLGPLVAGLLMAAYVGGAAITATGMALRQKDPALSATLEPVGQVVMALAGVPAIGSQMAGVAKWVMYGSTLAYAGLELAHVTVQRSNPELAEKLGWAAMAASLMDLAFAGMMKFARSMSRVGQKALAALRALRNKVKLHVISSLQRPGRRSRYLLDTRLQTGTAQTKTRWRDVELGGVRSNGRVMQQRVDLPGIHLFDDQVGFKHAITENNRLMGAFLDRELAQLRSARKAQLDSRSAIAYERSLDETRLGLKKLTTENTNLTAAKDKFKATTEKEYRSVKSATDEMDDLLSGKNNKGISLDTIKAANTDDFAAEFLDFEYKYSDNQFSGVTSIIEAAQKKAGINLANSLSASDWKRYATTLRSSLKTRHTQLESAHNAALEHIKKLESNFSKNFKLYKDKTLATLNQTHASYRSHMTSSPKGKSFMPADVPQHIAPKSRLNVISHGYTNHDSSEISQVVRYELNKDGKLTNIRTSPKKFYDMLIKDFKSNMKNSPHELKKLTKTSYQSITNREWQELFKKKYASIRLLSCNLAYEVGGTSYTQQLSQLAGIPVKGSTHRLLATISDSRTLLKEFRNKQMIRGLEGNFSDFFNSSLALPRHKLHVPKLDMPAYYRSPTYEGGTLVFHEVGYNYQMTTVTPGG